MAQRRHTNRHKAEEENHWRESEEFCQQIGISKPTGAAKGWLSKVSQTLLPTTASHQARRLLTVIKKKQWPSTAFSLAGLEISLRDVQYLVNRTSFIHSFPWLAIICLWGQLGNFCPGGLQMWANQRGFLDSVCLVIEFGGNWAGPNGRDLGT